MDGPYRSLDLRYKNTRCIHQHLEKPFRRNICIRYSYILKGCQKGKLAQSKHKKVEIGNNTNMRYSV